MSRTAVPSHAMSQGPKEVGSDQVGHACRQEGDTLLPSASMHGVHHPDRKRRFQHCDSHVSECDST